MSTRLINRGERLSAIEHMLFRSPGGLRVVEIAEACDVDRRTIYRDLETLSTSGVPVYQTAGRYYIRREYYLANLRLNLNEAITLMLAARLLSQYEEQKNPHLVSLYKKLGEVLPNLPAEHVRALADEAWHNPVDRAYVMVLETIIHGWSERRLVQMWSGRGSYEFATYFIEPSPNGNLYAVGLDIATEQIRALKIRRIKRAKLSKIPYEPPVSFNPLRYLSSDWGVSNPGESGTQEVILAFSAAVMPQLSQRNLANTRLDKMPDGRYEMRLYVNDSAGMLPWIRSWGAHVEVISPQDLRKAMATEAAATVSIYNDCN